MAYAGHSGMSRGLTPRGRRAAPPPPPPPPPPRRGRNPFSERAIAKRVEAARIPPNPYAGMNPSAATGGVFGPRGAMPLRPSVLPMPTALQVPATYALGDGGDDDYGQFGGFSLKGIAKAVKKVASPIQKAAAAVGHTVGTVVTSKVGQGILGAGLALTGVGIPAAAGIFAATKGVGNLIKPGGNIKHALTGAAQGAVEGVGSVVAGRAIRTVAPKVANLGKKILGKGGSAATTVAGKVLENQQTGGGTGGGDASVTDVADAQRQIAEAQAAAEAANREAARQVAEAQAAAQAARAQGQDDAARAAAEAARQLAAQQQAAADAAAAAAAAASSAGGSTDQSQLQALIDAAKKAAGVAQAAAAAPPTPAATAAVQGMATDATDATTDAVAGAPQEAGIMGSLTANPMLLLGGVALAVIVFGKKKRARGGH